MGKRKSKGGAKPATPAKSAKDATGAAALRASAAAPAADAKGQGGSYVLTFSVDGPGAGTAAPDAPEDLRGMTLRVLATPKRIVHDACYDLHQMGFDDSLPFTMRLACRHLAAKMGEARKALSDLTADLHNHPAAKA